MNDKEKYAILKMIEYINKSILYTKDLTYEAFEEDTKTQDATIFNISQIGELVRNITDETINKYGNIEWKMIKGLRNRIIHDYVGINLSNIWYVIKNDLPMLKVDLMQILNENR